MKNYMQIDCSIDRLIPFLRDFSHIPHVALTDKTHPDRHYLGFDHLFALKAAADFARKHGCKSTEISRDEVILRFHAQSELEISPHSNFDPLQNWL